MIKCISDTLFHERHGIAEVLLKLALNTHLSKGPSWSGCDRMVVSDLRQVCGFLRILRFPPPIKLTAAI